MHANLDQLISAANQLDDGADRIEAEFQRIRQEVDSLLFDHWKGIAPEVRQELWDDWTQGFNTVFDAHAKMAFRIRQAAYAYAEIDETNAQDFL